MRKNILVLITIGLLIFSGFGIVTGIENSTEAKDDSLVISRPVIVEKEEYVTVDFEESTSFLCDVGEPMLPIATKVYTLPFGSKINNIEVTFSDPQEISISNLVKPVPEPTLAGTVSQNNDDIYFDPEIYSSSELYPNEDFTFRSGSGLNDEEHVLYLAVHCYPVKYSPANDVIYYSENVDIKVEYDAPTNPVVFNDEYDLIIISPSKFSNELQPLIDHKNSYDVRTMLKKTEDILGAYPGRDDPEQIKYFIKDAIETLNAKYVLLIGDMDFMPMRLTDIDMWGQEGMPTDLYYADIYDSEGVFCSWDSDNDGKFGEFDWGEEDYDFVDLYADIKVGRIPCKNSRELKTAIGKIITYETQTYGQDWFDNALLMGGDTFPGHGPYEGEIATGEVSNQIPEFDITKLWTSVGNFNPRNINKEMSSGNGLVSYSGHGYELGFGTSAPNEEDRIEYFTPYTLGMLNNNKFSVVFFDACLTARLDYTLEYNDISIKFPCFAWYLIQKPIGGAVATVGATRVAFTMVDNQGVHGGAGFMNVHFFKAYEPGVTVSQMLVSAQNDYIQGREWMDVITLEEFILLGDPTLKVGGYPPSQDLDVIISNNDLNNYEKIQVELHAVVNGINKPYTYSWDLDEDGIYDDATSEKVQRVWDNAGVYWVSVKVTDNQNNEKTYTTTICIETKTDKPIIKSSDEEDGSYTFTANAANDLSWNEVYYLFDWGDGTYSEIYGPYDSDESVEATYSWSKSGTYKIRVKSLLINSKGETIEETGWSESVSITKARSRNYLSYHPMLEKLFTMFSNILQFLR